MDISGAVVPPSQFWEVITLLSTSVDITRKLIDVISEDIYDMEDQGNLKKAFEFKKEISTLKTHIDNINNVCKKLKEK